VTIAQDFTAAYRRGAPRSPEPQFVPDRLAAAAAEVTGIDGVGLGVFDRHGFTVPIGASSEAAALAERLQFTVGQGPCYDAHTSGRAVVATEPVMARRWPHYHDLLVTQTSFRSVVALPLTGPLDSLATIDLLFDDPHAADHAPLAHVEVVCRYITAALIEADLLADTADLHASDAADRGDAPVWMSSASGVARSQVMVAVGMLTRHLGMATADALKVLKGYAYANRSTTDQVAAALIAGDIASAAFDLDPT
jgi:hypothetical protein